MTSTYDVRQLFQRIAVSDGAAAERRRGGHGGGNNLHVHGINLRML